MNEGIAERVRARCIETDQSRWPIVLMRFTGESVPLAEWDAMFALVSTLIQRAEPFCMLIDARDGLGASAAHRKATASFLRTNEEGLRRHCRGVVTVSNSALVRGVITAIQWVVPPPFPDRLERQMEPAWRWLEQQLDQRP